MENIPSSYYSELVGDTGKQWQTLLDFGLARADTVEFAVPVNVKLWPAALQPLASFLIQRTTSRTCWGNQQITSTTYLRYNICLEVELFLRSQNRLVDWLFNMPQDPTFYQHEVQVLWTISHEELAFLQITPQEAADLAGKGINLQLWPPGNREEYIHYPTF